MSVIDSLDDLVSRELTRCLRLRQTILKYAFEGRLIPQYLNDEPASVLLERIRAERSSTAAGKPSKRSKKEPAYA